MLTTVQPDALAALKAHFGFDEFRGDQAAVINHLMAGHDTFVIMPTGAGKSLCYQLPAIMQSGTALVVSPLIALMKNQVDQLQARGISAAFLNSALSKAEATQVKARARAGELKLLYVAPETLVRQEFLDFIREVTISFAAIDEAHCISEWGHDFRPEYRRIRTVLKEVLQDLPITALTATATPKVQRDIQENLAIESAGVFISSFNRENLYYEILPKTEPVPQLVRFVKRFGGQSGIVYCLSRKRVEELAETLKLNGVQAVPYHAGLDADVRSRHQDMFLHEEVQVVVATIAFGMGIDKPDVRFVAHFDVPKSLESYYQETGRAGRDGRPAHCLLLYSPADLGKLEKFMKDKPVSEREAGRHLLHEMAAFCESALCRRQHLLHYFGERYNTENCNGQCDNCTEPKAKYNATADAQLILEAVHATGGHYTADELIAILQGIQLAKFAGNGAASIPQFGRGSHLEAPGWHNLLTQLEVLDYLQKDIADYGVLSLTPKGGEFLQQPSELHLYQPFNLAGKTTNCSTEGPAKAENVYDEELYGKLIALRKKVAQQHNVMPWVVFMPESLEEIAIKYPQSAEEFSHIVGVGSGKARKFAGPFIELVKAHVEENGIERPEDLFVKTTAVNSKERLFIIQQIDRQTPLDEIADMKCLEFGQLLEKLERIVFSGTRLNIDYYLNSEMPEDVQEDIYGYFREAESADLDRAEAELGGDYTREEIQLVRVKFYSEQAN